MKSSGYWMEQVLIRARALTAIEADFRAGVLTEYDVALATSRYEKALKKYTDPLGRKRG